jgi:hypothetical protein
LNKCEQIFNSHVNLLSSIVNLKCLISIMTGNQFSNEMLFILKLIA